MIVKKEKIEKDDQRLVKIDTSAIEISEDVISFALLAVTVTKDEEGNYAYGMDLTSPREDLDIDETITSEIKSQESNAAEIFLRRALKLALDEIKEKDEKEKEAQEKPN